MSVDTFQLTFATDCDPDNRAKIEKELARIEAGKLPLSFPRNTWNRGYAHWRAEADKDDQFTYSPRKRNRQDVLASVEVSYATL